MKKYLSIKRICHFITWWSVYWRWEILYKLLHPVMPVDSKTVCVISWYGRFFNCNPAAIASYLSNHNKIGLKIVAIVDDPAQYEKYYPNIHFVKVKSLGHLKAQLSCKVFISNVRMAEFDKKPGQIYIQTWHGMGPKKSEKDSCDTLTELYVQKAIKDCNQTDLMISGSKWQTEWIKKSTWYTGDILEVGTPRDDCFFHKNEYKERRKRVYTTYRINHDKKLILYAPTFRSACEIAQNSIDVDALIKACSAKFGQEYVLLLRLHPNVAGKPLPEIYAKHISKKVFNATLYPDMQDLLCASDVLITDFSSVSTEFVMQDKPCFLYIPDYKSYDRGLYFKPEEMPFPYSFDDRQLVETVRDFNFNIYLQEVHSYKNTIGMCENGASCAKVQDFIEKKILTS